MERHFPEAMTRVSPPTLADVPKGVHPGDRHVVAAAISAGADVIVTENVRHFPPEALAPLGVQPMSLDAFLYSLVPQHRPAIEQALDDMSKDYRNPPMSRLDILGALELSAPRLVAELTGEGADPRSADPS
jgi:hypothetical protein